MGLFFIKTQKKLHFYKLTLYLLMYQGYS